MFFVGIVCLFVFFVVNKFLFIFVLGVIFMVGVEEVVVGLGDLMFVVVVRLEVLVFVVFFILLLKLNVLNVGMVVLDEVFKLNKFLVGGVKLNLFIVWVFDKGCCSLLVLDVVDDVGNGGVNVGLIILFGFIVILGVVENLVLFLFIFGGEVGGLKVIIGGLGLLLLGDLKINFVLYWGFVEDFWVFVVVVINVVLVIVFVVVLFVL